MPFDPPLHRPDSTVIGSRRRSSAARTQRVGVLSKALLRTAVVLVATAALPASAHAAVGFSPAGSFGAAGTANGEFDGPRRVAVQSPTGNVFVVDQNNDRVQVFAPDGLGGATYLTQFGTGVVDDPSGIAIDQDTGSVYVSDADDVVKFDSDGLPTPTYTQDVTFTSPGVTGPLAFDQANDRLWIGDAAANLVRRLSASGVVGPTFDGSNGAPQFSALKDIAVDETGDVLVVNGSDVVRYSDAGAAEKTFTGLPATPDLVATVPGSQDVVVGHDALFDGAFYRYVDDEYHGTYRVSNGHFDGSLRGLAVGGSPGHVYVITEQQFGFAGTTGVETYNAFAVLAPVISAEAADPSEAGATLAGTIDPNLDPTTYYFEYGPSASYGTSIPVSRDSGVKSTSEPSRVQKLIGGLTAGATYHYRLVARNLGGTTVGADRTFTVKVVTGSTPAADSCPNAAIRAQQHASFMPDCRAWERVTPADKNYDEPRIDEESVPFVASDSGDAIGYFSRVPFPGADTGRAGTAYISRRGPDGWTTKTPLPYDPEGSVGSDRIYAFSPDLRTAISQLTVPTFLLYSVPDVEHPTRVPITEMPAVGNSPLLSSVTPDLSHLLFQAEQALTPDAVGGGAKNVYVASGGALRLVGILPDGSVAPAGAVLSAERPHGQMSTDGRRVFFTTPDDGRLYVRVDGATTLDVGRSRRTVPEAAQPARYQIATPDGRFVFFATSESLLDEDTDADADIYRYDVQTDELVRVTPPGIVLGGVIDTSADGTYLYYMSSGQDGANIGVKVWHDGTTKRVTDEIPYDAAAGNAQRARVTDDGQRLMVIMGGNRDDDSGRILVYDAPSEQLLCASCLPGETNSPGVDPYQMPRRVNGFPMSQGDFLNKPQMMSGDGRRIFFNSSARLVANDVNSEVDAYVYDFATGRQSLLSSGRGGEPAVVVNASKDGDTAFIVTRQKLLRGDDDNNQDVYAARVDGGYLDAPAPTAGCEGDACQGGAPSPAPASAPSSQQPSADDPPSAIRSSVAVSALTSVQRRALARGRSVLLTVRANRAGRVAVVGRSRLAGRSQTVLTARRTVSRAGTYKIPIRLRAPARTQLRRAGSVKVTLTATLAGASARAITFTIKKGK